MAHPRNPTERSRSRGWQTRRRIVEAAYRLFSEVGYRQTTIAQIAEAAGVAVPTVYLGFRNKPALFAEAYAYGVEGGRERPPFAEPWYADMLAERGLRRAVELWVEGATDILRRVAPLESAMRGLSGDPELADFERYSGSLQREGYRKTIDDLTEKAPLRDSLTREEATDILLLIVGSESYRWFTLERGWSDERWRQWSVEAMLSLLFRRGRATATRGTPRRSNHAGS